MASGTPVWSAALHLLEGVGEQGMEWLMMQARILRASGSAAAASSLDIEVVPAFDFSSAEYSELFHRADATAFQHPIWLDRAFRRLTDTSRSPAVLVGRQQPDRRLVLVLPMVRRRLGLFTVLDAADLEVGDYNAFVIDRTVARNPVAMQQIEGMLSRFTLVRIRKVRDGAFSPGGPSARVIAMDFKAHEIELATPIEGWQSRLLKPDFARFLRSKRKRLGAKGAITFEAACNPDRIRTAFESLRQFRQARWTDDLLADPRHFEFYLDVAVSGHGAGFARTYVLSVGDRILSVLFGIRHAGRFCFLLMGFDNQNFRNHSTGLLALESAIEDCIRHGDQVFDLTIGDEGYKQDFATRSVPMSVLWFGRKPLTTLAPVALDAAKRVIRPFRKPPRR